MPWSDCILCTKLTSGAFHTEEKHSFIFTSFSSISHHIILRVSDCDVVQDISDCEIMTNLFHSCIHLFKCVLTRCSMPTSFIRCQAINGWMYEAEVTLPLSGVRTSSFKMKNRLVSSSCYRCQYLVAVLCTLPNESPKTINVNIF